MLSVDSSSICDVCLDLFDSEVKYPIVIPCGHVFCKTCISSMKEHKCGYKCPICRREYHVNDPVRLHIEPQTLRGSSDSPTAESSSDRAAGFQAGITRFIYKGSSAQDLRTFMDQCHVFLKSQPSENYKNLRASLTLLVRLTETQSQCGREMRNATEAKEQYEALQTRLDTLQAEHQRMQDLIDNVRDEEKGRYEELLEAERTSALSIEESLRNHFEQMKEKYEATEAKCQKLTDELERLREAIPNDESRLSIRTASLQQAQPVDEEYWHLMPLSATLPEVSPSFRLPQLPAPEEVPVDSLRSRSNTWSQASRPSGTRLNSAPHVLAGQGTTKAESGIARALRTHQKIDLEEFDNADSDVEREKKKKQLQDILSDNSLSCSAPSTSSMGRRSFLSSSPPSLATYPAQSPLRDTFEASGQWGHASGHAEPPPPRASGTRTMSSASMAAQALERERLKKESEMSSASKYAATLSAPSANASPNEPRRHASIYQPSQHPSPYSNPRTPSGETGRARGGSISNNSHSKGVPIGGNTTRPRMPNFGGVYA